MKSLMKKLRLWGYVSLSSKYLLLSSRNIDADSLELLIGQIAVYSF